MIDKMDKPQVAEDMYDPPYQRIVAANQKSIGARSLQTQSFKAAQTFQKITLFVSSVLLQIVHFTLSPNFSYACVHIR